MIREANNQGAAHRLAHALRGLTPAERLAVLSIWALTSQFEAAQSIADEGIASVPSFSLEEIREVSGLDPIENCKSCILTHLRGFLKVGPGRWDFVLDRERLPW